MPDYKEMYLHLARETEKAVRILIKAQQDCEEMYISGEEEGVVSLGAPSGRAGDEQGVTPLQRLASVPPTTQ